MRNYATTDDTIARDRLSYPMHLGSLELIAQVMIHYKFTYLFIHINKVPLEADERPGLSR
jgi:hypothetical protein